MLTATTLDLHGALHLYREVFDVDAYSKERGRYVRGLRVSSRSNERDLYRALREDGERIAPPLPGHIARRAKDSLRRSWRN